MMKHATRHECANETKTTNKCFKKQITKLKEVTKRLKKMIEKTKTRLKKYLSKNNNQTVDDRDLNAFFAQDQRSLKAKIKQRNEIDNMNQRKIKDETNAEDERSENDHSDA